MKNIVKLICAAIILLPFSGCNPYNTWGDGLPELEHTYYVGFCKWTNQGAEDDLQYSIAADGTAKYLNRQQYNNSGSGGAMGQTSDWVVTGASGTFVTANIPFRFESQRVRSYDVVTYFWIEEINNALTTADYTVLSENGSPITRNADGSYSLTWPQAKKAEQNIKIKRNTAKTGRIRVVTLERSRFKNADGTTAAIPNRGILDHLLNSQTDQYTVRGFYFDYSAITVVPNRTANTQSKGPVSVWFD